MCGSQIFTAVLINSAKVWVPLFTGFRWLQCRLVSSESKRGSELFTRSKKLLPNRDFVILEGPFLHESYACWRDAIDDELRIVDVAEVVSQERI